MRHVLTVGQGRMILARGFAGSSLCASSGYSLSITTRIHPSRYMA
jgi:hypothetical protein